MLQLLNITKKYQTGSLIQTALDGVSMNLRDNEFVAVLGPSGSGKTTLLNIIGGLDHYDTGNLIINDISTEQYKDRDWDSYRNHTIGFVFQSYNLIPHQSILANVEIALTISGISRTQRRERAREALQKVGLGDQLHKKPNQLSGGQMQRVAIARALVNNPHILLADEPTGALDSDTSVQIMELLKEVAKDRLVVMVTHNPDLAERYANRTVKLYDGKIISDSNPYEPSQENAAPTHKNMGKASMAFLTSLSLSFNNLWTKKARTILTSFAGSIGIIGIALILALSTGVNTYIGNIQKETMSSYPITISSETIDVTSLMGGDFGGGSGEDLSERVGIYADNSSLEASQELAESIKKNNLAAFKRYLDNPDSEIRQYLGENGIIYTYNVQFDVYAHDSNGTLINTDMDVDGNSSGFGGMGGMFGSSSSGSASNFEELMPGAGDAVVSKVTTDSYDVLYGEWPSNYDEVVLVLNDKNAIATSVLCQLGLITQDEYDAIKEQIEKGEEASVPSWDFSEIEGHTFNLVSVSDYYVENADGTFANVADDLSYRDGIIANSLELKIVGAIRPKEDAANASLSDAVAYTSLLTDYLISHADSSAVVVAQEASPTINVLTGIPFAAPDDQTKIENATTYLSNLSTSEKSTMYTLVMYMTGTIGGGALDDTQKAAALDYWLSNTPDNEILLSVYDDYLADSTLEDNLADFGKVSYDTPNSISIYTDSFDDKEAISACIERYNESAAEDEQITYVDYVALLTSSITSIVNVISYVLIAFVAVSLVVSCIMIGIITHVSVLERTKEIGILRAIGASKRNISQVFNAETIIIGLFSGTLGVVLSELIILPINAILHSLVSDTVSATLPLLYALLLIAISVLITVIGGLLPSRKAANKDPVVALRTE